jgi:hypothetical protein
MIYLAFDALRRDASFLKPARDTVPFQIDGQRHDWTAAATPQAGAWARRQAWLLDRYDARVIS